MTTITLDDIAAEQARLAAMIAALQANLAGPTKLIIVAETAIELRTGEHYAGLALKHDGTPSHHLILLPGEGEDLQWSVAVEWAEKAGGALPSRQEQALLYANLKDQFKPEWHWSGEEEDGSYAWCQGFDDGSQDYGHEYYELRARAVRRLAA